MTALALSTVLGIDLGAAPAIAGHRGDSLGAPENTMAAFRRNWESGAKLLETDVQPSVDNVPVLIHDDTVDRTTDGTGTVAELRALDLAAMDAGSWFSADFAGARIPELAELLAELPADAGVLLELKGPHTAEQVQAVLDVCRASGADQRVLLHSFERDVLQTVGQVQPGRPVGLLAGAWDEDPIAACRAVGASFYHPEDSALLGRPDPAAEVAALHAAGIGVAVWNPDDIPSWEALAAAGVDVIMTNDPTAMVAWARDRQPRALADTALQDTAQQETAAVKRTGDGGSSSF